MRMGQKHIIYHGFADRQRLIFKDIDPLLHPVIHQNVSAARLNVMTASRYFVIRTDKNQLHPSTSLPALPGCQSNV